MKKLVCDQCGVAEDEDTDIFRIHVTASIFSWSGEDTEMPEDIDGYIDLCRNCYTSLFENVREEED